MPWRRAWQPTPVFLLGKSHGQRSLAGYNPWGHKELDMTEATEQQQHINSYIFKDSNTSIYLDYMLYVCVCVCVCIYTQTYTSQSLLGPHFHSKQSGSHCLVNILPNILQRMFGKHPSIQFSRSIRYRQSSTPFFSSN